MSVHHILNIPEYRPIIVTLPEIAEELLYANVPAGWTMRRGDVDGQAVVMWASNAPYKGGHFYSEVIHTYLYVLLASSYPAININDFTVTGNGVFVYDGFTVDLSMPDAYEFIYPAIISMEEKYHDTLSSIWLSQLVTCWHSLSGAELKDTPYWKRNQQWVEVHHGEVYLTFPNCAPGIRVIAGRMIRALVADAVKLPATNPLTYTDKTRMQYLLMDIASVRNTMN